MRDYFYFADKSSEDFRMYITDAGVYASPKRKYESVAIPGRNGNLLFEEDNYDNVDLVYPAVIVDDFDANYKAMEAFFTSQRGYKRLEDTYHPDEYYLATFKGVEGLKHTIGEKAGTFRMVFERKPQRFLKSGEQPKIMLGSGSGAFSLKNPSKFPASPIIRARTSGTIKVNDKTVTINKPAGVSYIDIDCELQEAYSGTVNCNGYIILNDGEFPKLDKEINKVGGERVNATSTGLLVTFSADCSTESTNYDYIYIYYLDGSTWYRSEKLGGKDANNNLAGATAYIPTNTFFIYWHSDLSVQDWGFKIDSVVAASSGSGSITFSAASSPYTAFPSVTWEPVYVGADNLPESNHPYGANETIGYEVKLITSPMSFDIVPRWWTI